MEPFPSSAKEEVRRDKARASGRKKRSLFICKTGGEFRGMLRGKARRSHGLDVLVDFLGRLGLVSPKKPRSSSIVERTVFISFCLL